MAATDFANQQDHEKLAWARETWRKLRESSFIMHRMGTSNTSGIQKITELTETDAGNKVIINLLHDLVEDGVVGDQTLKGKEEAAKMAQIDMVVDQLRHGIANTGRMNDRKGVLKIRNEATDLLSQALADRIDQQAFLTMAGVTYDFYTNGADRPTKQWLDLEYASYVRPPSAGRHLRWDGTNKRLEPGDTSLVEATDTLTWRSLVELKAAAHDMFLRPLSLMGGVEYFEVYVHPQAMKSLVLDPEFHAALKEAMPRTPDSPIFKGAEMYWVDGMAIYPYRHSYNTRKATVKWGAGADVVGNRVTLMGAQGMAYAELGNPIWEEEQDDYKNRWGIAVAHIGGFLKPQFPDPQLDMAKEDHGLISFDVALAV